MKTTEYSAVNENDVAHGIEYYTQIAGRMTKVYVLGIRRTSEGLRFTVTTTGKAGRVLPDRLPASALYRRTA